MSRDFSSLSLVSVTAGIGVGVVFGWILRSKLSKSMARELSKQSAVLAEQVFTDNSIAPECKLVIVVRNDLKMGKGKACAQCSHAAVC